MDAFDAKRYWETLVRSFNTVTAQRLIASSIARLCAEPKVRIHLSPVES